MFSALLFVVFLFLEGKEFSLDRQACAVYTKDGQAVSQETLDGVPVLRFSLDPAKKNRGEFYWSDAKAIPSFQTLEVVVHVRKGNGEWPPSGINLRIADRKSEIFQFAPKEIRFETKEKCTAVYEITSAGKQKQFWGGDRNGIMDQPCRIQGLSVSFSKAQRRCDILITGIEWETQKTPLKPATTTAKKKNPAKAFPFRLDLKTSHPIPVAGPEDKDFYAYITNPENRTVYFHISFTIRDAAGKTVFQKSSFQSFVRSQSRQYFLLPVPEKYGLYDVEVIAQSQEDPERKWAAHRSFAKLCSTEQLPLWEKREFRFGIDNNRLGDPSLDAAAAGLAGTAFLRVFCTAAHQIWPRPETTYTEGLVCRFREYRKKNIYPAAVIWAPFLRWMFEKEEDRKKTGHHMIHPDIWRKYCGKVFRAFGKYVQHFEVWNEPDLMGFATFSADDYYRLAKIAREEIDKNLPKAELMSSGFCSFKNKDHFPIS